MTKTTQGLMANSPDRYIDWKEWRGGSFGEYDQSLATYYALETGITARSGVRVLEIGFGNGSFIGWVHGVGVEVYGVELNSTLVDRARTLLGAERAFTDLLDERLARQAGTFSHVVAFDVIEHIRQEDLPLFFTQIRVLLAADGHLILRFPNGDSPFGRLYQHADPTHLTTIGGEKLRYFARQARFTVEAIRAPKLPLSGVGLIRAVKRAMLLAGRSIVERSLGFLYYGGRTIPLDPNYVAVLIPSEKE